MKCPVCTDSTLVMADRAGVEIDYCPACRGVWLDRGELDKIIERTSTSAAPRRDESTPYGGSSQQPHKKKKSSILGEIFDF